MTRRDLIKASARWLGATMTVAQFGALSNALASTHPGASPRFLDKHQFASIAAVADLMVPETETPGAIQAGVPGFIDLLLAEWATTQRQQRYVSGLAGLDKMAQTQKAKSFAELITNRQLALLQALDDAAYSDNDKFPFYLELKKMILFAYYTSEPGATEELRFQRIPGSFDPCLPLDEDERAWFWNGYSYGL